MAKIFTVFPDPIIETLRVLRTGGFADDPVVQEGETKISRSLPARTSETTRADLVVADDGDGFAGFYPLTESALMRISVWDADAHRATELARYARAHLLAYRGDTSVLDYRNGTRPIPTTDPDDGTPLASFTIICRLKAE